MNLKPLDSIQPFIDLGIYTVPMNGEIVRDETGKKKFHAPKNWNKFKTDFNEIASPAGAILTGSTAIIGQPGIIVLDCDSPVSYDLIKALDPDYAAIAESDIDKGGSFIYIDDSLYPTTQRGPFQLELFNGGSARMVFTPTFANKSKKHWYVDEDHNLYNHNKQLVEFRAMPPRLKAFLDNWIDIANAPSQKMATANASSIINSVNQPLWEPIVRTAVESGEFNPLFFRLFTPKEFRMHRAYQENQTLHPNDIPDGQGNDYLIKMANILVHDKSISEELFAAAMRYVNNLWDSPWDDMRISTLIKHQISRSEWRYDTDWEKYMFMFTSKTMEQIEYFYAQNEDCTYEINYAKGTILKFDEPGKLKNRFKQALGFPNKKAENTILNLQAFNTIVEPNSPFGKIGEYEFNVFMQTPALEVLNNPEEYTEHYTIPQAFIDYIESFIPDDEDREFFLRFWRTKFTTFNYSAIAFLVVGVPGSGKGTWSRVLEKFVGAPYIEKEAGKEHATEKFNSWLKDKYVAVFEELFKKLNHHEARVVIEQIKTWSGSTTFSMRAMRSDHITVPQKATFIINQNAESYQFDYDDRRFMIIETPNKLPHSIVEELSKELDSDKFQRDIAYYLATNYKNLSDAQYVDAPMSDKKLDRIFSQLPIGMRLFTYIKEEEYVRLMDYLTTFASNEAILKLFRYRAKNIIAMPDLVDVYLDHPDARMDYEEALIYFTDLLKDSNLAYKRTSMDINGKKRSVYRAELTALAYAPIKDILHELDTPEDTGISADGLDPINLE